MTKWLSIFKGMDDVHYYSNHRAKSAKIVKNNNRPTYDQGFGKFGNYGKHHPPATKNPPVIWNADDWQSYFDERAAIAEYDGGLLRAAAEQQAYDECVTRWLQLNPPAHDNSELCIHCHHHRHGQSFVSVINCANNLAWVHNECLPPWFAHRRQQAVAALGIQISLNASYNITKVVRK